MHGDLVNKHKASRTKERRGLARAKMTGETPPSGASKQALQLAIFGFIGVLAGVGVWLGAVSNGFLLGILIVIWAVSAPCAAIGLWRGKFELDSIARGYSPVRGTLFAKIGFFGGAAALVLDVIVLVLAIATAGAGDEQAVAQDSGAKTALKKYAQAIIDDDYETFKSLLSATRLEAPEGVDPEKYEIDLKNEFDRLHREDYAAMKIEQVKIEPLDENRARGTVFLRGTRDREDTLPLNYTLVKEDDEWKVGR